MGRTLMGIDLDESPLGGVIERLLDEEELEALDAVPDGGTDDADGDSDTGGRSGVAETPSPGTADDSRDRILESFADEDDAADGDDSAEGRLSGVRSRLRPLVAALAALAVLAVVAAIVLWRYGDRIAAAVPGPLGSDDAADTRSATDEFDSAAGFGPDSSASAGRTSDVTGDADSATGTGDTDPAATTEEASDGDLGALVGLAFLAVVAMLVRKFVEERDHDPLVDGE